eukprot:8278490-Pyramimonas_sp.AAC.1
MGQHTGDHAGETARERAANHLGDHMRDHTGENGGHHMRDYTGDHTRGHTGDHTGNLPGDHIKDHTGDHTEDLAKKPTGGPYEIPCGRPPGRTIRETVKETIWETKTGTLREAVREATRHRFRIRRNSRVPQNKGTDPCRQPAHGNSLRLTERTPGRRGAQTEATSPRSAAGCCSVLQPLRWLMLVALHPTPLGMPMFAVAGFRRRTRRRFTSAASRRGRAANFSIPRRQDPSWDAQTACRTSLAPLRWK